MKKFHSFSFAINGKIKLFPSYQKKSSSYLINKHWKKLKLVEENRNKIATIILQIKNDKWL